MADQTKAQADAEAARKEREATAKRAADEAQKAAAEATEEARKQSAETNAEQAGLKPYPSQEEADRMKTAAAAGAAPYSTRQVKP